MADLNFDGLQPDTFYAQEWFADFLDSYAETLNEVIRDPIEMLEHVRRLDKQTDPIIIERMLYQIGFNVPMDFIQHNFEVLRTSIQQLLQYHERSGTDDYVRMMTFIYGRQIEAIPLYTNDYKNFYSKPQGTLVTKGGDWYLTTHVELTMQKLPNDANLTLETGQTHKDRFLKAFYEFAPWDIVIHNFFFSYELRAFIGLAGVIFKHPKRYISVGDNNTTVSNVIVSGPDVVDEATSVRYELIGELIIRGDNALIRKPIELEPVFTSSQGGIVQFDNGIATFGNVGYDTEVTIFAEYRGVMIPKKVLVKNNIDNIKSISIIGPVNFRSDQPQVYTVQANTKYGVEELDVPITTTNENTYFQGNTLYADIEEDVTTKISASLEVRGTVLSTYLDVNVEYVPDGLQLVNLLIDIADELQENTEYSFKTVGVYSDGSTSELIATVESSTSAIDIYHYGLLSTSNLINDQKVTLTVKCEYKGIEVVGTKEVLVTANKVTLRSLYIIGDDIVYDNTKYRYSLQAVYSDGTVTTAYPEWETNIYSINASGVLSVGGVNNPVEVTIRATLDDYVAIKKIQAIAEPVVAKSLAITGPDNLLEGTNGVYACTMVYSDGTQIQINPNWSVVNNYNWTNIDEFGILRFDKPTVNIIEIRAEFVVDGKAFNQTKPIVCIPKTRTIINLFISGPISVVEGDRIQLIATALYNDGSTSIVTPTWEVNATDYLNDDEPVAYINKDGLLQGRYVEEETSVTVTASFYSVYTELDITVEPYVTPSPDVPVSSYIEGDTTMTADEELSFAHMILFENCIDPLAVSSDWTLDVDATVARIDQDGNLWSINKRTTAVTVTSTYICGTHTVVDSVVVSIGGTAETKLNGLLITGQQRITDLEPVLYTAELFYVGEEISRGNGTLVEPVWTIRGGAGKATVNSVGQVVVSDNSQSFTFTLQASYEEDFETVQDTIEITVESVQVELPKILYGLGPWGVTTDELVKQYLTNEIQESEMVNGLEFSLTASPTEFGYFCYPTGYGLATFTDHQELVGAWDGASWPEGDIGDYGPMVINRSDSEGNTSTWYLYRTDFEGNSTEFTYTITFGE